MDLNPPAALEGLALWGTDPTFSDQRLRIADLFPHDDVTAQWVFSVCALSEDLHIGTLPTKQAMESGDMRGLLFWYRHTVTRLYEARRLITSAREIDAVAGFVGDLLEKPPGGVDLTAAYRRRSPGELSTVEDLDGQLRHRGVHYPHVGSDELAEILQANGGLPAEQFLRTREDGLPDLQYGWVQGVRAMEVLGDFQQPDFLEEMRAKSAVTGAIGGAWTMVAGLALLLHAHRLGIDTERLGDFSGWKPPTAGDQ